jgi:hypothetical protein
VGSQLKERDFPAWVQSQFELKAIALCLYILQNACDLSDRGIGGNSTDGVEPPEHGPRVQKRTQVREKSLKRLLDLGMLALE